MLARASKSVLGLLVPTQRAAGPRDVRARVADEPKPSIVAEGTRIAGDIDGEGDVQVDGIVDGDVSGRCVTVGARGRVGGKIVAQSVVVSGSVNGGIAAGTVVLTGTARVACDIVQECLTIEPGAQVAGLLERPGMRVARPEPIRGEVEIVLMERVLWTRQKADRWIPLSAETGR